MDSPVANRSHAGYRASTYCGGRATMDLVDLWNRGGANLVEVSHPPLIYPYRISIIAGLECHQRVWVMG